MGPDSRDRNQGFSGDRSHREWESVLVELDLILVRTPSGSVQHDPVYPKNWIETYTTYGGTHVACGYFPELAIYNGASVDMPVKGARKA